jgi:hypothetical protein
MNISGAKTQLNEPIFYHPHLVKVVSTEEQEQKQEQKQENHILKCDLEIIRKRMHNYCILLDQQDCLLIQQNITINELTEQNTSLKYDKQFLQNMIRTHNVDTRNANEKNMKINTKIKIITHSYLLWAYDKIQCFEYENETLQNDVMVLQQNVDACCNMLDIQYAKNIAMLEKNKQLDFDIKSYQRICTHLIIILVIFISMVIIYLY